jgi:formamidopyrimidine-DNA glycosylase
MPELPEVEVTRLGIQPHIEGHTLAGARIRENRLRWPVATDLGETITGRRIRAVRRRAKYLVLELDPGGALLIHLGMSGSLRVVPAHTPPHPHDHVDLLLDNGQALRLRDPRRFGAILWSEGNPEIHPRLAGLGPEPLDPLFSGAHLHRRSRGRTTSVKAFLMDARVVVGVGNIYANEALFRAGIHPARPTGEVSRSDFARLAEALRSVLEAAIAAGGTTLRDFTASDGAPGYFRQELAVYDRAGEPCPACATPLEKAVIGQRSSFFCPHCQG